MLNQIVRRTRVAAAAMVLVLLLPAPLLAQRGVPGPANVTIVSNGSTATVSWTPVESRGVLYRVLRAPNDADRGIDLTDPIEGVSFEDGKVELGATYFYQVVAVLADGTLAAATPVAFTMGKGLQTQPMVAQSLPLAPIPVQSVLPAAPVAAPQMAPPVSPIRTAPTVTITGAPLLAYVAWNAVPGAQSYAVFRADAGARPVLRNATALTTTRFVDQLPDPRVQYSYTVVVYYPDRTSAVSAPVTFVSPPLVNPTGFTATPEIGGGVTLRWNGLPGVAYYRIVGRGLGSLGDSYQTASRTDTQFTVGLARNLPGGTYRYAITACYGAPGQCFADETTAAHVSVTVKGYVPHVPWLATKDPYYGQFDQQGTPVSLNEAEAYRLKLIGPRTGNYDDAAWLTENGFDDPTGVIRAVYFNAGDLGFGRELRCKQVAQNVACIVSNYGLFGVENDPAYGLAQAIAATEPIGSVGMVMSLAKPDEIKFYSFLQRGTVIHGASSPYAFLDSEAVQSGRGSSNYSPFNCLACHGGTYDPVSKTVKGASFLPLDVFTFKYSQQPGFRQVDQEEAFRKLNALVRSTSPNTAQPGNPIVTFINGMYGGGVMVPGTKANNTWVPNGWAAAPNVYDVFKEFCRTCHLAMKGDLTFSSYQKLRTPAVNPNTGKPLYGTRDRIQNAICNHTMPHAEVPFRKFWQNPNVSWVAYLEDPSVLGIKCTGP